MTRAPEFTEAKVYLSNGQSIIQVCHFIINDLSSVCKNYDRCFLLENLYFWTLFRLSSTQIALNRVLSFPDSRGLFSFCIHWTDA